MQKVDLRDGDKVVLANAIMGAIDDDLIIYKDGTILLSEYNNNMQHTNSDYDVISKLKPERRTVLQHGDIVKTREGGYYVYMLHNNKQVYKSLCSDTKELSFDDYNGFNHKEFSQRDIIEIYETAIDSWRKENLIWRRQEEFVRMTKAEIEKALGYKIKIVGEKTWN